MIDVFICTADSIIEPPIIVINTILSVLAYDYLLEKLSIYLSNDGGSIFTLYVLLEASRFAKSWIPFSRKFNLKHMSPTLLFKKSLIQGHGSSFSKWIAMEKLYKEMESRVNAAVKLGNISEEIRKEHEGFLEWSSTTTSKNHQAIVKVLIDGRDQNARDSEGFTMPTIIYMAREKHPKYRHNFKAGALNALVDLPGLDGHGGPLYIGSCCFHMRDCLNGIQYNEFSNIDLKWETSQITEASISILEERTKNLATCSYEENTQRGKEVADEETSKRYEKEIMEFGHASPMFTILYAIAMLNLFCLFGGIGKFIMDNIVGILSSLFLQFFLCGSLVLISFPIFQASFFRNDKGCIPMTTKLSSIAIIIVIYFIHTL